MPNATQAQIEETFRWLEKLEATQTEGLAPLPGAIELINRLNDLAIPLSNCHLRHSTNCLYSSVSYWYS